MKVFRLRPVIIMVSLAMVALIAVQVVWIRNAVQLKQEKISQGVSERLEKICRTVSDDMQCVQFVSRADFSPGEEFYMIRRNWKDGSVKPVDTIPMLTDFARSGLHRENKLTLDGDWATSAEIMIKFTFRLPDSTGAVPIDSASHDLDNIRVDNFKQRMWGNIPLHERIDFHLLDSLVKKEMTAMDIYDYAYQLHDRIDDTILFRKGDIPAAAMTAGAKDKAGMPVFTAGLAPGSYFLHPTDLVLYAPGVNEVYMKSLASLLIISAIVVLILLGSFWYFVKTALKQKKLAEIKNDFISNMTHEFKTPIANIALAVETISSNGMASPDPRVRHILDIIDQENNRLHENVKRIMQVSLYDRKGIKLEKETVAMHDLIAQVVKSIGLQAEQSDALIRYEFAAASCTVEGDETHLMNMVYNLLDNALKYSHGKPEILLSTRNTDGRFVFMVKDNGVGIASADQKMVFEKFFRVPTGNVHDVKGFGLGLSYVRSVAESHNGSISLESEPGKGTVFTVELPLEQ